MTSDDRAQIAATLWLRIGGLVPKRHRQELAGIVAALDTVYSDEIRAANADARGLGLNLAERLEQDGHSSDADKTIRPPPRVQ